MNPYKIAKILENIRNRMEERKYKLASSNKNIDKYNEKGIMNADGHKERTHEHKKSWTKPVEEPKVEELASEGWKTTESNQKIHIGENGVDAGNPHVVAAMNGDDPADPVEVEKARAIVNVNGLADAFAAKAKEKGSTGKPFGKNNFHGHFVLLKNHFKKHVKGENGGHKEFNYKDADEYERHAIELANKPVGKNILGFMYPGGEIARFNTETTEFVKIHPDKGKEGIIITYFKPHFGENEKDNPQGAMKYFMNEIDRAKSKMEKEEKQ